ncbi:hypothetical protein GCM10010206_20230 [Streptomyces cinerochromogenes]|nr:hypothetical protein GCM10010206_20230 [Streptomyces cinerochromogenes]
MWRDRHRSAEPSLNPTMPAQLWAYALMRDPLTCEDVAVARRADGRPRHRPATVPGIHTGRPALCTAVENVSR